ncbi:hypothetical protein [Corynebacterium aquatimens]|uniref:TIGR02569 family protein n=1 Tax=Corynebacterium aquatimens TaxID=1190508 RepID=A0A931GTM9_9CORY|nr:hypothetical protein [Corynebacterium aquatimens]MBG6123177.1 hypothetical protein [Corynebacterium aquatimens]WJY66492.1 hypothetical protein CAQUA_09025 [Corynebacterium aquatimens]
MAIIPGHVLTSFNAEGAPLQPLGPAWDNGVRCGTIAIGSAPSHTKWSAGVREKLHVEGLRIARPVRSFDGRLVVGGYRASDFIDGLPQARIDEAVAAALRLDDALAEAKVEVPRLDNDTVFARADRAVWEEHTVGPHGQAVHMDFLGTCVFSGSLPPAITDIVPPVFPRPRGFSAALVLIDGLLAGAVDEGVLERWSHVPDIGFLCERALDYREMVAVQLGNTKSNESSIFESVRALLVS